MIFRIINRYLKKVKNDKICSKFLKLQLLEKTNFFFRQKDFHFIILQIVLYKAASITKFMYDYGANL